MSERFRFVTRLEGGESITELAREFGISTKTAHKFWNRWKEDGVEGLHDRSHAVERIPHKTAPEVIELLVAARQAHPTWGARKLKELLAKTHPGVRTPSSFTMQAWLKAKGLIRPRRPRRRALRPPATPLVKATAPNEVWATDFKGQFRLGNGMLCYPLTATDLYSRYILSCEGLESTDGDPVWPIFERLFREHGLPRFIRTDNGPPFASRGLAGLSRLSVKWLRLGIVHERIEPGHPEQNGSHERMHRTLKHETTRPAKANLLQQQERFDRFVDEFNRERPHEAIAMQCPVERYQPSERAYQGLPELDYPLADDVCTVIGNACILMPDGNRCYLTHALVGQRVGIREVDDRRWLITFAGLNLGYYDERDKAFTEMAAISNSASPISPL